ncbi:MAG: imidazole glycerol phosphate synthase subunit HisH [Caldiserica bacterium]|nr:MAG: imidazole glycerol phosphate synthase subunit HisH [Caldisericota bacterium]
MIGVIDMGVGNLRSVIKAIEYLGLKAVLTTSKNTIKKSKVIVLPGVGSFDRGMKGLEERGIKDTLIDEVLNGKPFLGICLGMQLLFEKSEEGRKNGLGLIKGNVRGFRGKNLKIPHMGWNEVIIKREQRKIFEGIPDKSFFYFVHSYYCVPEDKSLILTETKYGVHFASSICKNNIIATQFHPEKSGVIGLKFLKNFFKMVGCL